MSGNFNVTSVILPTTLGDAKELIVLRAPTNALGGGLRIKWAYAVEMASGQTSGTAFALQLHKYSAAGTPAVNGTIAAAIGGTASPLAAGVPQEFVLDADYTFIDAGESVAVYYDEEGATNPTEASVVIGWEPGS